MTIAIKVCITISSTASIALTALSYKEIASKALLQKFIYDFLFLNYPYLNKLWGTKINKILTIKVIAVNLKFLLSF